MGLEALTHAADGTQVAPESDDDWRDWVSATRTRNFALGDPLLDWLGLHGRDRGFLPDDEADGYDPRTDFSRFIMSKGVDFEAAVVEHLKTLTAVHTIAVDPDNRRDLGAATETFDAMRRGEPCIAQASLRDADTRTYGFADLLFRSDELLRLFPGALSPQAASVPAPDLGGGRWHYRVIDIKFATLHFTAGGKLSETSGSTWPYMLQVYIYNHALGRLQGYLAPEAYLLGRGWHQTSHGVKERGSSCVERLGVVPQGFDSRTKGLLAAAVDEACAWSRRVRAEGARWQVVPEPTVPELRPDMGNTSDGPWHSAKGRIGLELQDLTMLWQVGRAKRDRANAEGIFRWSDPRCSSPAVGVTGPSQSPTLDSIIEINRSSGGPAVQPSVVRAAEAEWRPEPRLEFYVDFETVSDLDDDFSRIPKKGGQPLIFMIGCGHLEAGEWEWSCFTADALTEPCEARIIDDWFGHMDRVRQRLAPDVESPRAFHWSHAEESSVETAFNSAKQRHPEKNWGSPSWFDLLTRVVKEEPIIISGAFAFGLKAVAKALHGHGYIETDWDAGPTDGLGAMVGAWSCALEAAERQCTLRETALMRDIAHYNEVDCKVMMEILRYLRRRH